ncbi:MAG TPA: TolC family protein, partial [Chitinophagaceae bacterium]|nr:TolC family protein [Chitinophagaceae bacterium]
MKKLLFLLTLVLCFASSQAQISESYATRKRLDSMIYADVREKLVDLAFQNPLVVIKDAEIAIAENNLKRAKYSWTNTLSAQANINEFTLNGSPNAAFWPKYNFGVIVPFDIITRTSAEIRNARETIDMTIAMKEDTYRRLRAEVLQRFEDYLLHKELFDMTSLIVDEAYTGFLSMQEKYKVGDVNDMDY